MNRDQAVALIEQLRAQYVADDWPKRGRVKIAKEVKLAEPVVVSQYVIAVGTVTVLHPPKGRQVITAVIFYEKDRHISIRSDGKVFVHDVNAPRDGAKPRPRMGY